MALKLSVDAAFVSAHGYGIFDAETYVGNVFLVSIRRTGGSLRPSLRRHRPAWLGWVSLLDWLA